MRDVSVIGKWDDLPLQRAARECMQALVNLGELMEEAIEKENEETIRTLSTWNLGGADGQEQ